MKELRNDQAAKRKAIDEARTKQQQHSRKYVASAARFITFFQHLMLFFWVCMDHPTTPIPNPNRTHESIA